MMSISSEQDVAERTHLTDDHIARTDARGRNDIKSRSHDC